MSATKKSAGGAKATSSAKQTGVPAEAAASSLDGGQANEAGEGATFFGLNARYVIAPGATLGQLLDDCNCLLESGTGSFEAVAQENDTPAQWAGVYMLRQAGALFEEIFRRVHAGERIERVAA